MNLYIDKNILTNDNNLKSALQEVQDHANAVSSFLERRKAGCD